MRRYTALLAQRLTEHYIGIPLYVIQLYQQQGTAQQQEAAL